MRDFVILHPWPCRCVGGGASDKRWSGLHCGRCGQQYGLNIPVTTENGKFMNHMSCEIEAEGKL